MHRVPINDAYIQDTEARLRREIELMRRQIDRLTQENDRLRAEIELVSK